MTLVAFSAVFVARGSYRDGGALRFSLFDDAMISMRFARNLARGDGLVWNVGEPAVEGFTNTLWTLWMALLHGLGLSGSAVSLAVMATGTGLLVANVVLVRAIARRVASGSPTTVRLATWLSVLCYPLLYWTLRGMEVGLVAVCLSAAVLLAVDLQGTFDARKLAALGAALATGLLTRDDFLVPALLIAAFAVITAPTGRRRTVAVGLGTIVALTVGAHTAFRLAYYGDPLPNTYYLKVAGSALTTRLERGATALAAVTLGQLALPVVLAAVYVVASGVRRVPREVALLAAVFAGQCAYSVYVGGDAWEWMGHANRYVAPALPLLFVIAAMGAQTIASARRSPRRAWTSALPLALVASPLLVASLPRHLLQDLTGAGDAATRALVWCALGGAGCAWALTRRAGRPVVAMLGVTAIVLANGPALTDWAGHGGWYSNEQAAVSRYGSALRQMTDPDARIAVVWAGAIPYFADRPAVDLLGKSDRHVAAGSHRGAVFYPGHTKWDYAYSIGTLRPDLVAQVLYGRDGIGPGEIEAMGYERLRGTHAVPKVPDVFVRVDSTKVDRVALRTWLDQAGRAYDQG